MCYKNYDEWVEYIGNKYCSILLKKSGGDIKTWFNTIKTEEMEEEINNYHLGGDCPEISMIVATIAWGFDNINYNESTHKARSTYKGVRTRYSSGEGIFASLRNNWDKNDTKYSFSQIQLDIPSENQEGVYNWIEMCSALQKRYGIFKSLDDLNKFVFSVGRKSVFGNYGFYMRDLTHICLAYAIMHGYSIDEEKHLLQQAINAVVRAHSEVNREDHSAKNTYTEEARGVFEQWYNINKDQVKSFKCGDDNEKNFIQELSDNSMYIIKNITGYEHWSALKIVLNTLVEVNDSNDDAEVIGYEFADRLYAVYDEFVDLNEINIWDFRTHLKKDSVKGHIIKSLGIDKIVDADEKDNKKMNSKVKTAVNDAKDKVKIDDGIIAEFQSENMYEIEIEDIAKDIINNSLRYIYMIALMKQIKNQESCETAMSAIEYINKKLSEAGMRDVEDYSQMGNSAIPIDGPRDFFDGFIVECMYYEEKQEFNVVSGFDTFMQYMLNNAETL